MRWSLLGAHVMLVVVAGSAGSAGCVGDEPVAPALPPGGPSASAADASRPMPAPPARSLDAPDCARDEDCLLLPWVTCCGECPPAPPFEVGTIASLDAILIEAEQRCALDTRACVASPPCDPMPVTCSARAACAAGACVVIEDGCGAPVI